MFSFDNKLFSKVFVVWIVLNDAELKLSSFKGVFLEESGVFLSEFCFFCSSYSGNIPAISFFMFWDFCLAKSASFFLKDRKNIND